MGRFERKVAYSSVVLPSGEVLHHEVVVFSLEGRPLGHFPLEEEIPFVEWHDEVYRWPDDEQL